MVIQLSKVFFFYERIDSSPHKAVGAPSTGTATPRMSFEQEIPRRPSSLCLVCLELVDPAETPLLPLDSGNCGCRALYHGACLQQWIDTKKARNGDGNCPTCRSPVRVVAAKLMAWPCVACGRAIPEEGALVCVGPKCFNKRTRTSTWDARSKCYPCASVDDITAETAPDFVCDPCMAVQNQSRVRRGRGSCA